MRYPTTPTGNSIVALSGLSGLGGEFSQTAIHAFRPRRLHGVPGVRFQSGSDGTGLVVPDSISEVVKLNPKVQDDVNRIINERLAAERSRLERSGLSPKEKEELETLRQKQTELDRKAQEAQGNYTAALESVKTEYTGKLTSAEQRIKDLESLIKKDRIDNQLLIAASTPASGYKAVNPQQVVRLLNDRVTLDENMNPVVLGLDGKPEYRAGKNLSVGELVTEFLQANKHLAAPSGVGGSDEGKGAGGGGGETTEIAAAEKDYTEKHDKALKTGQLSDVTAAQTAKRKLDQLKLKKT